MYADRLIVFLLIPALAVILVALYLRYRNLQMFHQERMAALDKGVPVPVAHMLAPWSPRIYLLRGLLWSFAGVGLTIGLLGIAAATHQRESAENALLRAKNLAQRLDIPQDEAKQIIEKDQESRQNGMPSSVALLGLIPIGVGLAYMVFYYASDKRSMMSDQGPPA